MKDKKIITGTQAAKILSMIGVNTMLVAVFCNVLFDLARDSRTVFIILLCCCTCIYICIAAADKNKKK
ncbi:MAG: hypothetical protein LBV41_04450 [Cytophagaceae bacterium]|jgi:hypothetical protein|nr:hypothetical protein [Cytophagaceae bacterium]